METLPKAVWEGEFKLFGVPLKCYVLDDGRRIIDAEDMKELLYRMGEDDVEIDNLDEEAKKIKEWMQGDGPR